MAATYSTCAIFESYEERFIGSRPKKAIFHTRRRYRDAFPFTHTSLEWLGAASSRLSWLGLAPTSVLTKSSSYPSYPSLTILPQPDDADDSALYTQVLSRNENHS